MRSIMTLAIQIKINIELQNIQLTSEFLYTEKEVSIHLDGHSTIAVHIK